MWERVAAKIIDMGGEIHLEQKVVSLDSDEKKIFGVHAIDFEGTRKVYPADHVFSTMPIRELVRGLGSAVPGPIRRVSEGLIYRDFITVGLLLRRLRLGGDAAVASCRRKCRTIGYMSKSLT
jgi:protoporphyrinogen oxidase